MHSEGPCEGGRGERHQSGGVKVSVGNRQKHRGTKGRAVIVALSHSAATD